jgi:hypothetical protein
MSRPLRIEFDGALYHVTSRGDRQELIYEDDQDREPLPFGDWNTGGKSFQRDASAKRSLHPDIKPSP